MPMSTRRRAYTVMVHSQEWRRWRWFSQGARPLTGSATARRRYFYRHLQERLGCGTRVGGDGPQLVARQAYKPTPCPRRVRTRSLRWWRLCKVRRSIEMALSNLMPAKFTVNHTYPNSTQNAKKSYALRPFVFLRQNISFNFHIFFWNVANKKTPQLSAVAVFSNEIWAVNSQIKTASNERYLDYNITTV